MSGIETRTGQKEEDLGVLGSPVNSADLRRIIEIEEAAAREQARQDLYAKMAANMIITEQPPSNYFVRQPGL